MKKIEAKTLIFRLREVFVYHIWGYPELPIGEYQHIRFIANLLNNELKGVIVVDIGASDGRFIRSLRRFNFFGECIAIEPLSQYKEQLEKLNINFYPFVINDREGIVMFNEYKGTGLSSIKKVVGGYESEIIKLNKVYPVKSKRLDKLIKNKTNKLFLKIDVQGNEYEVLKSCDKIFSNVMGINIELMNKKKYSNSRTEEFINDYLIKKGFVKIREYCFDNDEKDALYIRTEVLKQ